MKSLYKLIGVYLAFLIQSLFFENLKIFSCTPDLLVTIIIIYSVSEGLPKAGILGAFAGLLVDVMYSDVLGINILIYMYFAIIVSIAADSKNSNSPLIMSWICFISTASMEIVVTVVRTAFSGSPDLGLLCRNIFVKGIFAAIFAVIYVLIVQAFLKRKKGIKSTAEVGEEASE